MSSESDYYLSNRPQQPKADIAAYVESQGIPVPKRFANLEEALNSGRYFIIRSEHPREYDGVEGINLSEVISPRFRYDPDDPEIQKIINDNLTNEIIHSFLNQYCHFAGISPEEYLKDLTYSYWKLIDGANRTIVADSAIEGRYHIFTTVEIKGDFPKHNYLLWEDGQELLSEPDKSVLTRLREPQALIDFYEKIRHLDNFDPTSCPAVELQDADDLWFLQYRLTRQFIKPGFTICRPAEEDEVEALLVRGTSTTADGDIYKVQTKHLLRDPDYYPVIYPVDCCIDDEDDLLKGYAAVISRQKPVSVFINDMRLFSWHIYSHRKQALWFNPPLSVLMNGSDAKKMFCGLPGFDDKGIPVKPAVISLRIVSDGKKGYIKLLREETEVLQ